MTTRSTSLTAQGKPITRCLVNANQETIFRPRGMKGFIWDFIVDNRLDVHPETLRFVPKKNLPRILTSDVYYDVRKPLEEAGYDVSSKDALKAGVRKMIQVEYVRDICDSLGLRRADIGILAGEAGHMFYRGNHYAVSLDDLGGLKNMGVIVLIIEKRGIAELLRDIAAPYGIALLSTQGFLTENVLDLAALATANKGKVAILTDYDISGMVIAHQVPEVPRIGIDETTLETLGILHKQKDLEEYYTPNAKHLKTVQDDIDGDYSDVDIEYLEEQRIEINAVRKEVGSDVFWEWIVEMLDDEFGEDLNYNRAVKIPESEEFVPNELTEFYNLVTNRIDGVLSTEWMKEYRKLEHYNTSRRK
jgi:5S rRNA maturation endonuclease (ribonuclease M5)